LLSPDFPALARAYDIPARRVTRRDEIAAAVAEARHTPGPALIEFQVEREDSVYPMVPAGADLHAMIRRPAEAAAEVQP
jgi:acetolactate synthase-1/2/3 large subunit